MIRDQQIMKSFAILALVIVFTTTSLGQTSGRISGTVKDMSGAVIPKSTVTATNTATGVKQSTTTDDSGIFSFPLLGIGAYTIEAEAPGFQTQSKTGIKIDVNSALTVDFALKIQEASQTVTVSEGEVQVETTDTQLGQTIES